MADANPSILSHISIGTNQFEKATAFYDQVLATLGCKRVLAHPGAVAYAESCWGKDDVEFLLPPETSILFSVLVPVLSWQITVAAPKASTV